jgi:pimeloyl-ACP methyl ester carboxylesterase
MIEGTVPVDSGRVLGFAEYGHPHGAPILMFHGAPGSRAYRLDAAALDAAGARLLSVERPGIGRSDPKPGRTLADWPTDVAAAADVWGLDTFAVIGSSAGGPYALAAGAALPDRVTAVGLMSALGPVFDHPEADPHLSDTVQALLPIAREDRAAATALVQQFMSAERAAWLADPDTFWTQFLESWAELDRPLFERFKDEWIANLDAAHANEGAYAEDLATVFGPWEIDLAALAVPVRAWHGTADATAPIDLIDQAVRATGGSLVRYEGEGHYLDQAHHADIVGWLIDPGA